MNHTEALEKITTDERFQSYQDFDPELLENLEYWRELPSDIKKFCSSPTEDGSEPYFKDVVNYVNGKILELRMQNLSEAIPAKTADKSHQVKL